MSIRSCEHICLGRATLLVLLILLQGCSNPEKRANLLFIEAEQSIQKALSSDSYTDIHQNLYNADRVILTIIEEYKETQLSINLRSSAASLSGIAVTRLPQLTKESEVLADLEQNPSKMSRRILANYDAKTRVEVLVNAAADYIEYGHYKQAIDLLSDLKNEFNGLDNLYYQHDYLKGEYNVLKNNLLDSFYKIKIGSSEDKELVYELYQLIPPVLGKLRILDIYLGAIESPNFDITRDKMLREAWLALTLSSRIDYESVLYGAEISHYYNNSEQQERFLELLERVPNEEKGEIYEESLFYYYLGVRDYPSALSILKSDLHRSKPYLSGLIFGDVYEGNGNSLENAIKPLIPATSEDRNSFLHLAGHSIANSQKDSSQELALKYALNQKHINDISHVLQGVVSAFTSRGENKEKNLKRALIIAKTIPDNALRTKSIKRILENALYNRVLVFLEKNIVTLDNEIRKNQSDASNEIRIETLIELAKAYLIIDNVNEAKELAKSLLSDAARLDDNEKRGEHYSRLVLLLVACGLEQDKLSDELAVLENIFLEWQSASDNSVLSTTTLGRLLARLICIHSTLNNHSVLSRLLQQLFSVADLKGDVAMELTISSTLRYLPNSEFLEYPKIQIDFEFLANFLKNSHYYTGERFPYEYYRALQNFAEASAKRKNFGDTDLFLSSVIKDALNDRDDTIWGYIPETIFLADLIARNHLIETMPLFEEQTQRLLYAEYPIDEFLPRASANTMPTSMGHSNAKNVLPGYYRSLSDSSFSLHISDDTFVAKSGPLTIEANYKVIASEGNTLEVEISAPATDTHVSKIKITGDVLKIYNTGLFAGDWERD